MKYNSEKYIGFESGYLTVIGYEKGNFICECKCGSVIHADPWQIIHKRKKSCSSKDCDFYHKCQSEASTTHGLTGNRLYTIWNGIIGRCYHTNNPNYKHYGQRGITMCSEWKNNVHEFIKWANENGYNDSLTIDRIDNNGNYEPNNCRWVDYHTQEVNKRHSKASAKNATKHIWTINGETKPAIEWCKIYNISFPTVIYRIKKYCMKPEEALTMNKITTGRPKRGDV